MTTHKRLVLGEGYEDNPERVWKRRVKGWRQPENTVTVSRPSVFGNPYPKAQQWNERESQQNAKERFDAWVVLPEQFELRALARERLRKKNLACWCRPGTPCHADTWLLIANSNEGELDDVLSELDSRIR